MTSPSVAACCTEFYGHPLARFLLGDSFHPGGLAVTEELLRLADVRRDDSVLDAGSGLGTSAVHIAATVGSRVTGVTLEDTGVEAARKFAAERGVADRTTFLQGDFLELAPALGPFEAVLLECVLSTLPNKLDALRILSGRLHPGGKIAISDVTVDGPLPERLRGPASAALCLADALTFEGYAGLLRSAGLRLVVARSMREKAAKFIRQLRGGLLIAEAAAGLGISAVSYGTIADLRPVLKEAQRLVDEDRLGYALFVAVKDD